MPSIFGRLFKGKSPATPAPTTPTAAAPLPTTTPKQFDAVYAKALNAATARDLLRAIDLYDEAIALEPTRAEPYYKRANALKDLGHLEEALASYDQAIACKPDYAYAYCNRGFVQHSLGLLDEALASYDRAVALEPGDAVAHYNRALLLQDLNRWNEALASYDQAIAVNPEFTDAHYNRAVVSLYSGDFESGWRGFEWRWRHAQRLSIGEVRNFEQPLWLGETSLVGQRLLLHSEAGLGDTVQFCRYANLAAARGATVILEVQPPLVNLLANLEGVSQVIAAGSPLPPFDYHCPLMSLPLAFETTPDTVPSSAKYLCSDPTKVAAWRALLGERRRPRIGLAWSGNPRNPIDQRRTLPLADWTPRLAPEFEYFRLQKDLRNGDQAVLAANPSIISYADEFRDFTDTAAFCECMDIIITVDTSVAHLSGALGRKTWLLLAFTPDWRWMRDRTDTPWYPSMKLYRQKIAGAWNEVLDRVAADLQREFRSG